MILNRTSLALSGKIICGMHSKPHGDDINAMTECVTDYINFCLESIISTRTVRHLPKNKPLITSDPQTLLNFKKKAFREGDRELLGTVQKQLKNKTIEYKEVYRKKL